VLPGQTGAGTKARLPRQAAPGPGGQLTGRYGPEMAAVMVIVGWDVDAHVRVVNDR
jgi:hypothetical protein